MVFADLEQMSGMQWYIFNMSHRSWTDKDSCLLTGLVFTNPVLSSTEKREGSQRKNDGKEWAVLIFPKITPLP